MYTRDTMYDAKTSAPNDQRQPKDYNRLRGLMVTFLSHKETKSNRDNLSRATHRPAYVGQGICKNWSKKGKCNKGDKCPYSASHTPENRGNGRSRSEAPKQKAKAKGKAKLKSPTEPSMHIK